MEKLPGRGMKFRLTHEGTPFYPEMLFRAGVLSVTWYLPSCDCLYQTREGDIRLEGEGLKSGPEARILREVAIYVAVASAQAQMLTFRGFLEALWRAGVSQFHVDYICRTVSFYA